MVGGNSTCGVNCSAAGITSAKLLVNDGVNRTSRGRRHIDMVHAAIKNDAENAQKLSTSRPVPWKTIIKRRKIVSQTCANLRDGKQKTVLV